MVNASHHPKGTNINLLPMLMFLHHRKFENDLQSVKDTRMGKYLL
jgi:hypothetical protein